jgi:hypothetical protein
MPQGRLHGPSLLTGWLGAERHPGEAVNQGHLALCDQGQTEESNPLLLGLLRRAFFGMCSSACRTSSTDSLISPGAGGQRSMEAGLLEVATNSSISLGERLLKMSAKSSVICAFRVARVSRGDADSNKKTL